MDLCQFTHAETSPQRRGERREDTEKEESPFSVSSLVIFHFLYVFLTAISRAAPNGARDTFCCALFYKHFTPNGARVL